MDDLKERRSFLRASRLKLKKGDILDVGLEGCACMSFFMAERGFNVTGIDPSSWAIHISRRNAKKEKMRGSFQAKRANAEKMPFRDNMFDAVIAYNSLHHIEDLKAAISEISRVCKKGGWILISDLNEHGECKHPIKKGFLNRVHSLLVAKRKSIRILDRKSKRMFFCRK